MTVIMTSPRGSEDVSTSCATNVALFQADTPSDLPAAVQAHFEQLSSEVAPESHLERIYIQQIARHAAAVDLAHACETTILETSGRQASFLAGAVPADDAQRIAAVSAPALSRLGMYYARHERALAASIQQLQKVKRLRQDVVVPRLFSSEQACATYLAEWQMSRPWTCFTCGGTKRWSLQDGKYECGCGRQYSIRLGTVYADSHVPLSAWFGVIAHVIVDPRGRAVDVARQLSVRRVATISNMIRIVHDALGSDDADQRLAGVHRLVLTHLLQPRATIGASEQASRTVNNRTT